MKNVRKLLRNTFSQENHRQYSLEEIISAYEKDCDIYEYDSLNKKYNIVKQDEKNRFVLHKSENSISIDAANMIEEEMMEISFDLKDNSITKISILCGD
ncbi:MAG: hypothetical protein MJ196_05055 [Treponemataceae bacterium]|nr:hypothetical protein [Treponemataceae bacterium]